MSSRLPSRPGSVPEYIFCDDQETCQAGARRGGASAAQRREPRASLLILCQLHRDRTTCGVTYAGPAVERTISPERRCSSRTFRYGYLVTT